MSSALTCYTTGVWGECFRGQLKTWHLWSSALEPYADATGMGLMEYITQPTHLHDTVYATAGIIVIYLMLVYVIWATWTYFKGSLKAK